LAGGPNNTDYARLVRKISPRAPEERDPEQGLDALITQFEKRKDERRVSMEEDAADPIQALRESVLKEYIPVFVELSEKYAQANISMEMDASNLLQGGREIKFSFSIAGYRTVLLGTATSEAIAFHETRYTPNSEGELASGPLLRLRRLDDVAFKEFICAQLAAIVRTAMRKL
jgi:hypothetical protein